MDKLKIDKYIYKLKKAIIKENENNHIENVLILIRIVASLLYETNICYFDDDLENTIIDVSAKLNLSKSEELDESIVLFYDGFGFDNRGLVHNYLNALCKVKKVIYVTYKRSEGQIPEIEKTIKNSGGVVLYLSGTSNIENIDYLNEIVIKYCPHDIFFYSYPDDVVGVCVLNVCNKKIIRYQINLTDHAFWLGARSIDFCLEFRDYGAYISNEFRKIPKEKILWIPFYPMINHTYEFEGFPFSVPENTKVVFSGGALYKTFGDNNKYYEIVRYLLSRFDDVVFWYAGSGDDTEMRKIIHDFPNRAFLTSERKDLFEVLKHSYFYLSTYPVCGGLMFQYAAVAGKLPITLKNGDISNDFLINQSELGIEFDSIEDLYVEFDHIFTDKEYLCRKEEIIANAVITPEMFDNSLECLLNGDYASLKNLRFNKVDVESFQKIFSENYTDKKLLNLLVRKDDLFLFFYMPNTYLRGLFFKLFEKFNIFK